MALLLGRHLVVASVVAVMLCTSVCSYMLPALEVDSSNIVPIVRNCVQTCLQTTVMSKVSELGVSGRL